LILYHFIYINLKNQIKEPFDYQSFSCIFAGHKLVSDMSDEFLEHVVYSKEVLEFVTVAREYCATVEGHSTLTIRQFISRIQKLFPLLYLKATLLPEIDNEEVGETDKFVTEVDYNFLLNKLTSRIGRFDSYQEVFDAGMQFSDSPLEASIAENICDVYQDLKDFLMNYRLGSPDIMEAALVECRNNFENYWGQKLTNGLRALHNLLYCNTDWNESSSDVYNADDATSDKKQGWVSNHFNSFFDETDNDGVEG
jgi:hypothetical protein